MQARGGDRRRAAQDTNDQFLANYCRRGLYSVVPRIPGGEISPEKIGVLADVGKRFGLYTKITGGQRIDLFGARVDQLPEIWEHLVKEGFESGHAYAKALRTVKSCVGSSWCRFGVQDSVTMAIDIEERYKGLRMPHKVKSAASGCVRECAEAQGKDFGVIATEKGWNLYFGGNGGAKPRHADLFATDLSKEQVFKYTDRYLLLYIRTADRLERTARWQERLEGGIEYLKDVIINDRLGICAELDRDMDYLVRTYNCEWKEVVEDPEKRRKFRHFINTDARDPSVSMLEERGQRRPSNWIKTTLTEGEVEGRRKNAAMRSKRSQGQGWTAVGDVADWPKDGGLAVKHGPRQVAVFNFSSVGKWFACQNVCPHMRDQALARGLLGVVGDLKKIACAVHKNTWNLETGRCMSDSQLEDIQLYPVRVEGSKVLVRLPPAPGMAKHAL